ncbi:cation:proton antiporter [Sphingomonas sp.]|uniref:cation:proton antiporter domain-containing protein n=1 Tax=Sphingomonas sp. TaxID=28214 RepID=UPI003B00DA21
MLFALVVPAIAGARTDAGTIAQAFVTTVAGGILCGITVGRAATDRRAIGRPSRRAHADGARRLRLVPERGVDRRLGHAGDGDAGGQLRPRALAYRTRRRDAGALLGLRGFLANSVVFLLTGSRDAKQSLAAFLWPTAVATALVLAGRAVAIFPVGRLIARYRAAIDWLTSTVPFQGGLRGAFALATPASLPEHDALVSVALATVAFSIFVHGATMPMQLRRARRTRRRHEALPMALRCSRAGCGSAPRCPACS